MTLPKNLTNKALANKVSEPALGNLQLVNTPLGSVIQRW